MAERLLPLPLDFLLSRRTRLYLSISVQDATTIIILFSLRVLADWVNVSDVELLVLHLLINFGQLAFISLAEAFDLV